MKSRYFNYQMFSLNFFSNLDFRDVANSEELIWLSALRLHIFFIYYFNVSPNVLLFLLRRSHLFPATLIKIKTTRISEMLNMRDAFLRDNYVCFMLKNLKASRIFVNKSYEICK